MAARPVASVKSSTVVKVKPGSVVDGGPGEQTALLTADTPLPRLGSGTGYTMSLDRNGSVIIGIDDGRTYTLKNFEHVAETSGSTTAQWNLASATYAKATVISHGQGRQMSVGGIGADTIDAQAGDLVFGGAGVDLVTLSGKEADYDIRFTADGGLVLHHDGEADITLHEVERLRFSDREVAVTQSNAGVIYGDLAGSGMVVIGGAGANTIVAGGHDTIDGGAGRDTVVLGGRMADYAFSLSASGAVVAKGADGSEVQLRGVGRLVFSDGEEQLVTGSAGNNNLKAGPNALVLAGDGNDTITLSGNGSVVWGGKGTDGVRLSKGISHYSFWRSSDPHDKAVYAVDVTSGEMIELHDVERIFDDAANKWVDLNPLVQSRTFKDDSPTGNVFADSLIYKMSVAPGADGVRVVHYCLYSGNTNFFTQDYQSSAWTTAQAKAFRQACSAWEAVTNVKFVQVNSPTQADLVVSMVPKFDDEGALGVTRIAEPSLIGPEQMAFVNSMDFTFDAKGDSYGVQAMMHELGHALGLDHPFDDGGPWSVGGKLGELGLETFDTARGTIMSYTPGVTFFDGHRTLQRGFMYSGGSKLFPSPRQLTANTPMAFDIAAMQAIYGAKNVRVGNNTYMLNDTLNTMSCILDTGGIDTLGYAGKLNAVLDLRAATLDRNDPNAAGAVSYLLDSKTGQSVGSAYTIAHGVVIENASGGWGNDTLTGNDAANVLSGNDGDDLLMGGNGNDLLIGGNGADTLIGGAGADTLVGGPGADLYVLDDARDSVVGADAGDTIIIRGAGDAKQIAEWRKQGVKVVTMAADLVTGGSQTEALFGLAGADTLDGSAGVDTVDYSMDAAYGGTRGVVVNLAKGTATDGFGDHDKLVGIENAIGTAGADTFRGSSARNHLVGGDGNDVFLGLGKGDSVDGGDGDDLAELAGRQSDWMFSDDIVMQAGRASHVVTATNLATGDVVTLTDVERLQFGDGSTRVLSTPMLMGTNGGDTLVGWDTNDLIYTGLGDDSVEGAGGADTIVFGGGGDDLAVGAADGGAGDDLIQALAKMSTLILTGSAGADTVDTYFNLVADYSGMTDDLIVTIDGDREHSGKAKAETARVGKGHGQIDSLTWNHGGESDGSRGILILNLGKGADKVDIDKDKTQTVFIQTQGADTVVSKSSDIDWLRIDVGKGTVSLDLAACAFETIFFDEDQASGSIHFESYNPSDRAVAADVHVCLGRAGWHRITSDRGAAAIGLNYDVVGETSLLIDLAQRHVTSISTSGGGAIDDQWDANTRFTYVAGSIAADSIIGSSSADVIIANLDDDGRHLGEDTVSAGGGDDIVYVRGRNLVDGGDGIDTLSADEPVFGRLDNLDYSVTIDVTKHTMTFHGDVEGEVVNFSNFEAYSGNREGNDVYIGSDANETFITAGGNDTMTGGKGKDTFRFTDFYTGDHALITDFEAGQDIIDLSQAIAGSPKLAWGFMDGNRGLFIDRDGDGQWDFSIYSANAIGVNDVRVR